MTTRPLPDREVFPCDPSPGGGGGGVSSVLTTAIGLLKTLMHNLESPLLNGLSRSGGANQLSTPPDCLTGYTYLERD